MPIFQWQHMTTQPYHCYTFLEFSDGVNKCVNMCKSVMSNQELAHGNVLAMPRILMCPNYADGWGAGSRNISNLMSYYILWYLAISYDILCIYMYIYIYSICIYIWFIMCIVLHLHGGEATKAYSMHLLTLGIESEILVVGQETSDRIGVIFLGPALRALRASGEIFGGISARDMRQRQKGFTGWIWTGILGPNMIVLVGICWNMLECWNPLRIPEISIT
jgi:hypothetical protein